MTAFENGGLALLLSMADASTSDTTLFVINGRVPRTDVLGDVAARTGAALPRREGAARRHRRVG